MSPRRTLVSAFGPPAIERGISPDLSHGPNTRQALRRQSIHALARPADRISASGLRYVPGRVIVKFKNGMSAASRVSAISSVSRTASMAARSAWQDFDIVQTAASENAEDAARALRARADVEYAQAAYRVRPAFVPNDQFYSIQWNLKLIDMERAWDIQPAGGSAITVAVLDTGIAYRAATLAFTAGAFTVDADGNVLPPGSGGTAYPARGNLTLQFVAATSCSRPGGSLPRATSSGTTRCRSILTATGPTSAERSASSPTTARTARRCRQWRRHGGRRVQRQAHAGESAQHGVGRHLRVAQRRDRRHRRARHRAPPITARRSST
jgi:hypothetical protein